MRNSIGTTGRIFNKCYKPKMKTLRIAAIGQADDYTQSLIPLIIKSMGCRIRWSNLRQADIIIFGPFFEKKVEYRWAPKPIRSYIKNLISRFNSENRPLTIFQTGENKRHDFLPSDYSISFDLNVKAENHIRLPYWMEMIDWKHEGIHGNTNPRYGELLDLGRLRAPLGASFLSKPKDAVMFSSHLFEPRKTLIEALQRHINVTGYGRAFDASVAHHLSSNFTKAQILSNFSYNFCPENSLYPGYYTEKIPEAFASGALPITWADPNVCVDFNEKAFINLIGHHKNDFEELGFLLTRKQLKQYTDQPLITHEPTLDPIKKFAQRFLSDALS
jgi:hypothetical protein